eukprot:TCALIF_06964-PA protein Name:"Similar to CLCA1 Calcium-activated chloride channel regulator 1 (Homo sapiens)" AED:0.15 eAED:0.15 QI:1/1/0.33/1/1/1/3/0/169
MVEFKLPGLADSGVWSYKIRVFNRKSNDSAILVDVTSVENNPTAITLEAFTNVHQIVEVKSEALKIYAKLQSGTSPVLDAKVFATVYKPDSAVLRLELTDDGFGYPDLTQGDGIYSGYLSQFATSNGYYGIEITAINGGEAKIPSVSHQEESSSSEHLSFRDIARLFIL